MSLASRMMTASRKPGRWHWTDIAAYAYLALGVVLMFGPVLWLGLSSFKTQAGLLEFPPSLLPMSQKEVALPGQQQPLPLFEVDDAGRFEARAGTGPPHRHPGADGRSRAKPGETIRVPIDKRTPGPRVQARDRELYRAAGALRLSPASYGIRSSSRWWRRSSR